MSKDNPRGWHVQLWETEWVIWGYGPDAPPMHTAPAEVVITTPIGEGIDPVVIRLPFELPDNKFAREHPPEIVERKRGWGWRFKSNQLMHDTDWNVADSREEALEQAAQWIEDGHGLRNPERPEWREYVKDVREMKPTGNPLLDILNSA